MKIIDFRSDTVTKPTEEMKKAMYDAEVGDDVYGEDVTVNKLEELSAKISGKEAGLFLPSGTMGNLIALMSHTGRSQQVIVDEWSHIMKFEGGGIGSVAGLLGKEISVTNGIFNADDIAKEIVGDDDIHCAKTGLVCIENTHNMAGGTVTPLDELEKIYWLTKSNDIPLHTDGARIFYASTYLNKNMKDLAAFTDSIMFCLSKGLCAPVGSVLTGTKEFIDIARRNRKTLGGGMRQAGVFAAAGIVSINTMSKRLEEDHDNLMLLASMLQDTEVFTVDMSTVQTNILMVNVVNENKTSHDYIEEMKSHGILASAITDKIIRFVTHYYTKKEDILATVDIISKFK